MPQSLQQIATQFSQINTLRNRLHSTHNNCIYLLFIVLVIGKIVGYLIFISYFTILPYGLKIIWPYLFHRYQYKTVFVGINFLLNIGIFIAYNSVLYIIYTIKHPFFEQYRNTLRSWPWQQNPEACQKLKKKSFIFIFVNFFVITPIMLFFSVQKQLPYSFSLQSWPTLPTLLFHFTIFLLAQDLLFYLSHRLLHVRSLYWIHKLHHQHHNTISLAAHCLHPIEYVLSGTLPSTLGFQLLSNVTEVHYSTILVWLIFRLIHGYEVHCGYLWSWNALGLFPGTIGSDHHEFHHRANSGNYGSVFVFWDAFFGTEGDFVNFLEKQVKEKQEKQVKQIRDQKRQKIKIQKIVD